MDYNKFINNLSFTATISTIGLFLCGLQICFRIWRRGTTDGTGVAPFWLTLISCIFWFGYGWLQNDNTILFVNGVGFIFQSVYFCYYYFNTRLKHWLNKLIVVELAVVLITYYLVKSDIILSTKANILGNICMCFSIATIGSPLLDLGQVLKTKSTESLPFMLCVGNLAVSVQWLLYGYLIDDFYMKASNTVAVIISTFQLSLFLIYSSKYKIVSVTKDTESLL